ncbi:murein L,D-transpeptidase [Sulfuriroseicoccus oceanibius]|uniref:Murein L,D-transpeptidase n=2 Tax=Sulfuriroseicoccus oceanibius TaxID=2707525 RepID=A0A6B3LGV8_9BACT|nr:murein L,D-transpeptidase [Sulfuriroseicoccus oceanibius]
MKPELDAAGVAAGDPVFLRVFKESSEMELWMQPGGEGEYVLVKNYPVAKWSGELGPKLAEGDYQAPEGVYFTNRGSLNPFSKYHLSFNINYPNAYDKAHGRTGSFIMVHGSNVSIGCYAMTDPAIEEIYGLVEDALKNGQNEVSVHCFPFRMTPERLQKAAAMEGEQKWEEFWRDELVPVYEAFEDTRQPPVVRVEDKRYVVE